MGYRPWHRCPLVWGLPALLLWMSACGSDGEPAFVSPVSTAALLQPGPYGVGYTEVTLLDPSRATMPNRSFPGSPRRVLPTAVWYPVDSRPGERVEQRDVPFSSRVRRAPLVIYSHGFLGNRRGGAYLAQHLATHGYVVAAADFPLSSFNAPGGATLGDLANQPGDVSFLIDRLLQADVTELDRFAGRLERQQIGLVGLSLGGATTLLTAFHPSLRDARVRAAVVHAAPACFLTRQFYANARVPLALVHGDIDAIVPFEANAEYAFRHAFGPKYLFTLHGASHTAFTDGAEVLFGQVANADNFGCAALSAALAQDPAAASFVDLLGGAAAGVVAGRCPLPCALGSNNPPALHPRRQHEITTAATLAHFEAWLRGNGAARAWMESRAAGDIPELEVAWEH